ncbi:MAG: TadE/TadG family type IV pilus assembly protein [Pseudomonadota bacterium]
MSRPARMPARRQGGIAALELALLLPLFLFMIALPLFWGRVLWQYSAFQKATHDAARYLASVPIEDIQDPARANFVKNMAISIFSAETAELNSGNAIQPPVILCGAGNCGANLVPTTVTITADLTVSDIFFPSVTRNYIDSASSTQRATVTFPFVGN